MNLRMAIGKTSTLLTILPFGSERPLNGSVTCNRSSYSADGESGSGNGAPSSLVTSSWSAAVITTMAYVLCSTGFHKWAERRSCEKVWEAPARSLEACKDVLVGYVNRGNIVRANNLHHSRRWIRRAGDKNGNMAIAKCVDEEPYLPTVEDAHESGFKIIFARVYACQSVSMLANGSVRWKLIQNAVFEKGYRTTFNPHRPCESPCRKR